MPNRKQLLILTVAVTVALLVGYIPQFLRARGLQQELETVRQQLNGCQSRNRAAALRDMMGLAYLEVNQKNYGVAGQHAARFFERAGQVRAETSDPGLQNALGQAMSRRDEITAGLARGDSAVTAPIETTYRELLSAAPGA
ncbi:MAG TPA: hypothetical protein VN442_24560 [Bryobacteraceae bacterium]|nr:hypothetical protein [Bryobacteraceae bacterium]